MTMAIIKPNPRLVSRWKEATKTEPNISQRYDYRKKIKPNALDMAKKLSRKNISNQMESQHQ